MGAVTEGKVTGITKFGAFVALDGGKSGLVHISEISNTYVSDVNEHLQIGQQVKVKVIGIDENGRINLSIKKALPPVPRPVKQRPAEGRPVQRSPRPYTYTPPAKAPVPSSFEDKLKQFMQESDSRISDLNRQTDKRGGRSRRRG